MLGQSLFICEQQVSSRRGVLASCCLDLPSAHIPPPERAHQRECFPQAGSLLFLTSAAGKSVCVLEGLENLHHDVRGVCVRPPFPSLRAAVVARPSSRVAPWFPPVTGGMKCLLHLACCSQ